MDPRRVIGSVVWNVAIATQVAARRRGQISERLECRVAMTLTVTDGQ